MPAEEATMVNTSLIFSGGPPPNDATLNIVREITDVNLIIAADSGLHTAQKLNLKVDAVIGDLDSVSESALARASSEGTQIIRHNRDKDFTDLNSALLYAAEHESQKIVVVTAGGGRLDHQFGVLAAMFNPTLAKIDVEAIWNDSQLFALQGPKRLTFSTNIGDLVGIQSFSDISKKITTTGLRWPLKGEQLTNHETRGVSNEATELEVSISLETGQLLITRQLITRQLIQKIKQ